MRTIVDAGAIVFGARSSPRANFSDTSIKCPFSQSFNSEDPFDWKYSREGFDNFYRVHEPRTTVKRDNLL